MADRDGQNPHPRYLLTLLISLLHPASGENLRPLLSGISSTQNKLEHSCACRPFGGMRHCGITGHAVIQQPFGAATTRLQGRPAAEPEIL